MIGRSRHVMHCQDGVAGESEWEKRAPYVFLSNGDDDYYWQGFETREELEAFITQLREAGDKAFASAPAPVKAGAPEAGGFVRLSKHSDHGKPYRAFTHAQEQARAELAPAIAALIVRDVCETDPADPADPNTVSVNVDVLSEIVSSNLATPPGCPSNPWSTTSPP